MPVHDEPSYQAHFIYIHYFHLLTQCVPRACMWRSEQFCETAFIYLPHIWVPGIKFRVSKVVWQAPLCAISLASKDLLHTSWVWSVCVEGLAVLGIEPRSLCMQGKHSMTEETLYLAHGSGNLKAACQHALGIMQGPHNVREGDGRGKAAPLLCHHPPKPLL